MEKRIFVGIDGGASKTIIRAEEADGRLLGQTIVGPTSLRLPVNIVWETIINGMKEMLQGYDLAGTQFHVGIGIAGSEIKPAYREFISYPHPFANLAVSSDSHIACIAAHDGKDGSIIIIGTGSVGYQIEKNRITQVGGWGFPHDDVGSGAWLGLQGIKHTLHCLDGRNAKSELAQKIFNFFNEDKEQLIAWANGATPSNFASVAPLIIELAEGGDFYAIEMLKSAAREIDGIAKALEDAQSDSAFLPCTLIGGIAQFVQPFLHSDVKKRLRPAKTSPERGAILLIRDHLNQSKGSLCHVP